MVTRPSLNQEVGVEEDKEEGAVEMEKVLETNDDGEADVEMNEGREEEEEDEETMETIPDHQDEEAQRASAAQQAGGGGGEDEGVHNTNQTNDGIVTGIRGQGLEEEQEKSVQSLGDEREGDEEESGDLLDQKSEEEEEPCQDDRTGEEQESDETTSQLDINQIHSGSAVESTAPPLSRPESQSNADSGDVLLSPPCEDTTLLLPTSPLSHLPPAVADFRQNVPESPSPGGESSAEEEQAETAEHEGQEESRQELDGSPPASVPHPTDLSKVRFTIAPARQRSQSSTGLGTPSSPVPGPGGVETERETKAEAEGPSERGTERDPGSPAVARTPGEDTPVSRLVKGDTLQRHEFKRGHFHTCSEGTAVRQTNSPYTTVGFGQNT